MQYDEMSKPEAPGKPILLGKASAQYNVQVAPAVTSLSLLSGWNNEHTKKLAAATAVVVEANPVLSGHLEQSKGNVYVRPGTHRKDVFVVHEQPSENGVQDLSWIYGRLSTS